MSTSTTILSLPNELLQEVFIHLVDPEDYISLSSLNKRLRFFSTDQITRRAFAKRWFSLNCRPRASEARWIASNAWGSTQREGYAVLSELLTEKLPQDLKSAIGSPAPNHVNLKEGDCWCLKHNYEQLYNNFPKRLEFFVRSIRWLLYLPKDTCWGCSMERPQTVAAIDTLNDGEEDEIATFGMPPNTSRMNIWALEHVLQQSVDHADRTFARSYLQRLCEKDPLTVRPEVANSVWSLEVDIEEIIIVDIISEGFGNK
ncbi:hypothetical protein BJ508DRAFT_303121 [Ascobolus immersus RN42]|uniref:F-box domain-containing protein n=1 Tax=Ascobolus immersus RN42 TaxID=1160509 RepID=A0A3N4II31_ASCIM|nr:hypothetical protein BJ508DRAFT_303121 [Ascobolus immersus RN42]